MCGEEEAELATGRDEGWFRDVVGHLLEFRALDFDGEDAGKTAGGFQPVGLDGELGGVADGFAGRGVGDGSEGERRVLAAGHRDEFDGE